MTDMLNRRAALGAIVSGAMFAAPCGKPDASASPHGDAEILALGAEILTRCAEADKFKAERIEPHDERFLDLIHDETRPWAARSTEAFAYSKAIGRDAAITAHSEFGQATDALFNRLMAIRATTQAGRAAKVRALLVHVMCAGWRGPAGELDWDREMARTLLGEFAGLDASDLEAI